ncbi:putative multiple-sugar transport system permease YteP [Paenibacillus marchantiophytorum]|uniref:Multiple-sugar transport system permease YteP n=1 Tax=Paenibacillus marchantiophytorum TaxID=1619310 RepID=A0ABQ1EKI3_9BACL|nr:ABC transporter permease subunit [Paenibacillus marchantiophytorum]GFZ75882.1 putative multiple-sugar transport system permease YteP [Paenibacillus marchantiophytorum]
MTTTKKLLRRGIPLYAMIAPGVLFFLIFRYLPMFGIAIAFQNYDPFDGFLHSDWVGLEHFRRLFSEQDFWILMRNTLAMSCLNLFLFFPAPIILALLLNEVRVKAYRKSVQTITYLPHFLSWVVVVSMTVIMFSTQDGALNKLLISWGWERFDLLMNPDYFRTLYLLQNIWKETGWSAIIFLAALASVDPTLFEAAVVDGASRWKQMLHISLPALKSVIFIMFILRLGQVLDIGFEHVLLMQNPLNMDVSDIFDTYVYRTGILSAQFSFTTAVGLFKSVVGLVLVIAANTLAKRFGEEGVY